MKLLLFLLTFSLPALLVAQEASSTPKDKEVEQTSAVSCSEVTRPSVTGSRSLEGSVPDVPVDPSAAASPESAASNEISSPDSSASETPAPIDPNTPTSNSAEEVVKVPQEQPLESVEKKEQQLKVRYYQVRTQVENNPEVSELKQRADHAGTDELKRQALRDYYELLFKKMKAVDSSISDRCDTMQAAYLRHLEQVTLEPTIALAPFSEPNKELKKKEPASAKATPQNIHKKKKHPAVTSSSQENTIPGVSPNVIQ